MNRLIAVAVATLGSFLSSSLAYAIADRHAIRWLAQPEVFVDSLYRGVLGRAPETPDVVRNWARRVNDTPKSRIDAFWAFVASPEYRASQWAKEPRNWWTIRKTMPLQLPDNRPRTCHCYSVSKSPRVLSEAVGPSDKKTYRIAQAVGNYMAVFDRHTCPGDCGIPPRYRDVPAASRVPDAGPKPAAAQGAEPQSPPSAASDSNAEQQAMRLIGECRFSEAERTISHIRNQKLRAALGKRLQTSRTSDKNTRALYAKGKAQNDAGRNALAARQSKNAALHFQRAADDFKAVLRHSPCSKVREVASKALAAAQRNITRAGVATDQLDIRRKQIYAVLAKAQDRWIKANCRRQGSGCAVEPRAIVDWLRWRVKGAKNLPYLNRVVGIYSCNDSCIMGNTPAEKCINQCKKSYPDVK